MKILYDNTNGKIYYSVYDTDWFKFSHSTNIPLTEFTVDEINPDNKAICQDLRKYGNQHRLDINGNPKYYMHDNLGVWELHEKTDWQEHIDTDLI